MTRLTLLLLVALTVATTVAQQNCNYNSLVWFLLDMSETAQIASSTVYKGREDQKYDILADQVATYASSLPNDVNIGIISYTGNLLRLNARVTLYPAPANTVADEIRKQFSPRATRLIPDGVITQNGTSTGASTTLNGLKVALNQTASKPKNMLVVVSAQGSRKLTQDTVNTVNSLRQKGFSTYVVQVQTDNVPLEGKAELDYIGGPNRVAYISSYKLLSQTLANNVTPLLKVCATPTAPAPTVPTYNPCAKCQSFTGTYNVGHNNTCTKFYMCLRPDPSKAAIDPYPYETFDCNPNTLFDDVTRTCVWPQDYSCAAWGGKCQSNGRTERFAHLCCTKYWECDSLGIVRNKSCPSNNIFDGQACVPDTSPSVADKVSCSTDKYCLVGQNKGCVNHRPVPDNACVYEAFDPNSPKSSWIMPCNAGMAWNQIECACSTIDATCNVPDLGVDQIDGFSTTGMGGVCNPFFSLPLNAKTWANNNVMNVPHKYYVEYGQTIQIAESSYAKFTGAVGKQKDLIFIPFFANRDFATNFAMTMDFRFENVNPRNSEHEFILVSNDRCGDCSPTLQLTAKKNQIASTWDITFWVKTTGIRTTPTAVSVTGVSLDSTAWNHVVVTVQGSFVVLTVKTNIATKSASGKLPLSTHVKHNMCGLSLGQGRLLSSNQLVAMQGAIDDFKFYECSHFRSLH